MRGASIEVNSTARAIVTVPEFKKGWLNTYLPLRVEPVRQASVPGWVAACEQSNVLAKNRKERERPRQKPPSDVIHVSSLGL